MSMLSPPRASCAPAIALSIALSLAIAGCAGAENRSAPAATGAATGSIEGRILHPARAVPALRICAIGSGAPAEAKRICVKTRAGQGRYRIAGLAADDYVVIAAGGEGPYRIGGHVQPVQCIRAPCPDMPVSVTVATGANVAGIDINGFYEKREDFPAISPK